MLTPDADILLKIVDSFDEELFVFGAGGNLEYCNEIARLQLPEGEHHTFDSLFGDGGVASRRLAAVSGSSDWAPVNLPSRLAPEADGELKFRGRGMRTADGEIVSILLADRDRDEKFIQCRQLVQELNVQLAQRQKLNDQLTEALATEERLHRELIHRVKNNLALLQALISLRRYETSEPAVRDALDELEHRVHAIVAVHQLLDQAGEIDFVQAGDLIRSLCIQLQRSVLPEHVEIENELLDIRLNVKYATPLSLLINELITNAAKHAFPDGRHGKVHVELKKNGVDKLEVGVRDNGAGSAADQDQSGTGGRIVHALAEQIGGTLEKTSTEDGTHWSFIFPLPDDEPGGSSKENKAPA